MMPLDVSELPHPAPMESASHVRSFNRTDHLDIDHRSDRNSPINTLRMLFIFHLNLKNKKIRNNFLFYTLYFRNLIRFGHLFAL
jgi:hypothetical protein